MSEFPSANKAKPSMPEFDVAVIGAGPAGMSAAIAAARRGVSVVLLDEQDAVGGQIYRGITKATARRLEVLGPDYASGAAIADAFLRSGATHMNNAAVWQVGRDGVVNYLRDGKVGALQAKHVVIASGAMERPFPIPGWTLPGVMTAGAAQILLKGSELTPSEPVVLAGCGPLLYLLGWQYLRAGVPIKAIVDTTGTDDYRRAIKHLPDALAAWPYMKKGLTLLKALKRGRVPFFKGATNLAVEGTEAATALRFESGGRTQRVPTKLVLLHQGVVPNTQFTWSLRAGHAWNEAQLCWVPKADAWGRLDVPNMYIAGDGMGIGGAVAAALQGTLSGLAVAAQLGKLDATQLAQAAAPIRAELASNLRIRPFLDAIYRPKDVHRIPVDDDVVVCRCEEVTAGQIREYVALGCTGPNQTKSFGRCGMGPCQGRLCGLTVTEVIADARGVSPADVGYYRIRPPIKPVTLGELANEA